ncbi:MAG: carbohydrate-binding protein [Butyrivibrio sp.]|nr:carbohydrate-binding protein [Butyrivibrio sp.]
MKGRVYVALSLIVFSMSFLAQNMIVTAGDQRRYTGPTLDPYSEIQAETNFFNTGDEIREKDGRRVVSLDKGEYFRVKDVNFDRGMDSMTITVKADSPACIKVRKDDVNGKDLGCFMINGTKGKYIPYTEEMNDIWGKSVIYFVCSFGSCSIDYWKAGSDRGSEPKDVINPYKIVEAETMENAGCFVEGDTAYAAISDERTLVARNVDFSEGISDIEVITQTRWYNTEMYIYIDEPYGPPFSKLLLRSQRFGSCIAHISSDLTGVHDVYFKTNNPVDFDSWIAYSQK